MSLGLLLSLLFIYWLITDRARRLHVSVNILTQIANAYIDARDHALDAIERHNQLADDYNTMAEKLAALAHQKAENQKRVQRESEGATGEDAVLTSRAAMAVVPNPQTADQVRAQIETQVRQRFGNRISALQEKNKTLRTSLNEALAQIEELKRQQASTAGA
jgi:chromosome segregation ATPase